MLNRKIIFTLALLLVAGFTLQAQPGGGGRNMDPAERAEQQTAQMTEQLALSEAQAGKVKEINLKYANKMKEARDQAAGDWSAMRETMTALRGEQDKELQTVLTKDQWTKWAEFREQQRANRGEGMGRGNRPDTDKAGQGNTDSEKKAKKKKEKSESDN